MPLYKYSCPKCVDIEVAVERTILEPDNAPQCPKCDAVMLREFGIQTIRFIGSGWAKNDS